jgi:hypothetical protein
MSNDNASAAADPEKIYLFVQHLGRRLRDIDARAGLTRLVRDMERDGLLVRTPDPDDGRGVLIQLTPRAAARFDAVRAAKITLVADYLATLDAPLRAAIGIAFRALDQLAEPTEPGP